ncbi:MAG: 8-oxoguanine deaminase [Candidatus Marinimicrobia bacterium]|nr:8-oxoguanine deaminase [Candidatus Neomarinimicrobiota bacterium]
MTNSILIQNPLCCALISENRPESKELNCLRGGHIFIENGKIKSLGNGTFSGSADRIIDAYRMVVLPGFVNTHHHFFQTLTRNIFSTQSSPLFDWLTTNYEIWRELSGEAVFISAKVAIAELLKSGCTTTSDHLYLFPKESDADLIESEILAARDMGMRFQPTRGSMSLGQSKGGLPPDSVIQDEKTIVEDVRRLLKKYHDSSSGAMTRISLAPCSPFSVTPELMKKTVELAEEYNLQIHTHLAETLDEEKFCIRQFGVRPFAYLKQVGWIRKNAWFAHAIHLNDAEIREMGENSVGISHCPTSNMRLGSGIARISELLHSGVNVSLGVDGSASNDSSNMLMELRNTLLLSRLRDQEKWLTVSDILWMATRGGAKALGRDDIGEITVGKCADLILIDLDRIEYAGAQHDPLAALLFSVPLQPVDYSIINGKIVVDQGKIVGLDESALIRRQQEISDLMVEFAEKRTGKRLRR